MNDLAVIEHSYTAEILRKGIHLASLSIPVIYYFIPKATALGILVPLTLLFLGADVLRLNHGPIGALYHRVFGFLLRKHEQVDKGRQLTGASYVLISATLGVWFLPKLVFITAFAILIVSDSAAALIGRRFGRRRFLQKSLEGSSAFFVTALIVVAAAPKAGPLPMEYIIGAMGAFVGTVAEAAGLPVDDNISIPFSIGATMWALYSVLLPTVDIFCLDHLL